MNEFVHRVADALDAGLIPWRMPHLPRSAFTGRVYTGMNPLLLQIAAGTSGSTSPWWGTSSEWQALGVLVAQSPAQGVRLSPSEGEVFNLQQTDQRYEPTALTYDDPAQVIDAIVRNAGVSIEYGFDATCEYNGAEDRIRMPHRWLFEIGPGGISGYWDAKSHELHHWSERRTGWDAHPDICELRAEIGSGYLLGALGIKPLPLHLARHHRRYASRWAQLMRQQPSLLLRVCDHVVATVNYLLRFAGKAVVWRD